MTNGNPNLIPERNPVTHKKHRRDVFRQITLPFLAGLVIVLGLAAVFATRPGATVSLWADISLIGMIIPACIGGFILLAILAGLVYLHILLIRKIPVWFFKLHDALNTVGSLVRKFSDKLVAPLLKINSFFAGVKAADRGLRRR